MPKTSVTAPLERLAVLYQALQEPKRYVARWYGAYLLLGATTAGIFPILVPLWIVQGNHHAYWVAYVFGAYNLGLLTSPLWGQLSETREDYRLIFLAGFGCAAVGMAILPITHTGIAWTIAAFLVGVGTAAASTVASLFVFDFTPRAEWEPRIGWLQSFNGIGLVIGLLLAGAFTTTLATGLWVGAALLALAVAVSSRGLPMKPSTPHAHRTLRDHVEGLDFRALAAFGRPESLGSLLRHSHHLTQAGLRHITQLLPTRFGRFLTSWFALSFGVAAFFAYFPILLRKSYGVPASLTALTYALAATIGIVLYVQASSLCARFSAARVYWWALWLRGIGFATLLALLFIAVPDKTLIALLGFCLIVLAWPLLSVSGTTLAGSLSPLSEGAAIGLFNAATAVATVGGTLLGGPLAATWGYSAILALGIVGLLIALIPGLATPAPERPST